MNSNARAVPSCCKRIKHEAHDQPFILYRSSFIPSVMQAVILVGGLGTRLQPLTLTTPKPLVPLANRPVIEHVVRWLAAHGVDEVLLATQYQAAAFERWLRFWRAQPATIPVRAIEEPEARGTAGAVGHLAHLLHGTTVVVNGDNLLNLDLSAMRRAHVASRAAATIATDAVNDVTGRGVVASDAHGRVVAFQEKPAPGAALANTVNTGVYLLEPSALATIPSDRVASFERDVFPALIGGEQIVGAWQSRHVWIDTGTPGGYLRAQAAVLNGAASMPAGEPCASGWCEDHVTIDSAAQVVRSAIGFGAMLAAESEIDRSVIGRECHVLPEARIVASAVWDGSTIERRADICDSIIGRQCFIGAGAQLAAAVLGDGCVIGAGAVLPPGTRLAPRARWP
jgi:mannose-1-phosphate guanylyltransferase